MAFLLEGRISPSLLLLRRAYLQGRSDQPTKSYNSATIFCCGIGRGHRFGALRIGVDHFSGTRIAELLASLSLNGLRVGLQALNFFLQPLVFPLQRLDFGV